MGQPEERAAASCRSWAVRKRNQRGPSAHLAQLLIRALGGHATHEELVLSIRLHAAHHRRSTVRKLRPYRKGSQPGGETGY